MKNIIKGIMIAGAALVLASCSDFLNRPSEDGYNTSNFYKTDVQLEQGVNYLYNSPWYDFQRGFIKVGEVMSGNMFWGDSPYLSLTVNGTDTDLKNMSYSLWSVNAHCNAVIDNILACEGPSQKAKNKAIGEALTLKALAYFFLVRTFGEVPIIHNNMEVLNSGNYNEVKKATKANVYEYIIMTLEKAMELLPANSYKGQYNRIDYYAAEALLAKVYLTKAGVSGTLDPADLKKAADYALDVIENSGRELEDNYSDIFRLSPSVHNKNGECLISWQWTVNGGQWTRQNTLQSDLQMEGFGDHGDLWGGWGGPSVDLQDAFGVRATDDPSLRANNDDRRQATMMLAGDVYPYFWTDKGGFDFIKFLFDPVYGKGGPGQMECQTGACNVKHCYGNDEDHKAALGFPADRMAYQLPTHILRLADIYLVYAEAVIDTDAAAALDYVNKVRARAHATAHGSVTRELIWKERRLELAGEGDYWYDFVRRSYYQSSTVIAELKAQKRSNFTNLGDVYKYYFEEGSWDIDLLTVPGVDAEGKPFVQGWVEGAERQVWYGNDGVTGKEDNPTITEDSFTLPFPTEDVVYNPNVGSSAEPEEVDVRGTYKYNF